MIELTLNTKKFEEKLEDIVSVYQRAFAGYPWFENLSDDEVQKRLVNNSGKNGFQPFIAEGPNGEVAGALWYDTPTLEQLSAERGKELAEFASTVCQENNLQHLIWEREVLVDPQFQKQGIATRLRTAFLSYLIEAFPDGALMLTRMRDDNIGIIKIAERVDYARTGIRVPSSQTPGIFHEYWYKVINPNE